MIQWLSAEEGSEGRGLLEDKLTKLEAEIPKAMFKTKNPSSRILLNRSGSETILGLYEGHIFFCPAIFGVEVIDYDGLRIKMPGSSINNRSTEKEWDGLGTLISDDERRLYTGEPWRLHIIWGHFCTGQWTYGFFINDKNYRFNIFNYEEPDINIVNERMDLCGRITSLGSMLTEYRYKLKPRLEILMPFYRSLTKYYNQNNHDRPI